MASYVVLSGFTEQGIRTVKETAKRANKFRETAKEMGATIKEIYWTLGRYDVVVILEAADDETVARLMMKMGALGNLKSETLRAFSEEEIGGIVSRI
ncbi:MAG: GYD domain-containing protein [Candidatus Omnitrophica bacterium]|nr:GYD domain-containing protein [Candidatus Omnitrophota bacterium]MDD5670676.1 GYD domain-containing protein [Candidatus Omnitrophota bacterium]